MYIDQVLNKMEDSKMKRDAQKVYKVFQSCQNIEHIDIAKKMFHLWRNKHGFEETHELTKALINYMVSTELPFQLRGYNE